MKKEKVFMIILSILGISTIILNSPIPTVFANNHTDTRFDRYYNGDGSDLPTPIRSKTDASSMYSYNDQSNGSYTVTAYAATASGTMYGSKGWGGAYTLAKGQAKYISNYVYENGYRYGGLFVGPNCSHVKMLWSPDSIWLSNK